VPNSSPTAASASSDLYGAAVLDACRQLNERLAPVRERLGCDAGMNKIADAAWFDRIDLCAHGWYITPDIDGEPPVSTQCLCDLASGGTMCWTCCFGWHNNGSDYAMSTSHSPSSNSDVLCLTLRLARLAMIPLAFTSILHPLRSKLVPGGLSPHVHMLCVMAAPKSSYSRAVEVGRYSYSQQPLDILCEGA
jgi:Molybdopterin-binding domain of aldehyde dehydrogenase